MNRSRAFFCAVLFCGVSLVAFAPHLCAKDFAPITEEQRALTAVPGQPGAPAVILQRIGRLDIMDYPNEVSSKLEVSVRLKILTQEGLNRGQVGIHSSRFVRLRDFDGRTILPDGREIPLPKDSVFEEDSSRSRRLKVTKAAFSGVEEGAIIDYSYTLVWDSPYYLEPWVFHDELPVMLSEITYVIPKDMQVKPWARQTTSQQFQVDQEKTPQGLAYRVRLENLAGMPDEPLGFPRIDLSSRFMIVPSTIFVSGSQYQLMETWTSTCEAYLDLYTQFQRQNRLTKKRAKALAADAPSTRARVAALYRFVRDEIATQGWLSVGFLDPDAGADKVLEMGRGTGPEKALLLQVMLEANKIDADLIWAADSREGIVDLTVPNPWWFESVLVRVVLDGKPIFLDPSDRDLAMGHLNPYMEGTPALVYDRKRPEVIELPTGTWEDNQRKARVRLEIDEEGRVTGDGSLIFTGHHAWRYLHRGDDDESTADAWKEWLQGYWEGYDIGEIEVEEKVDEQTMRVDWTLTQREEEVLGDEVSLLLSRPLGPVEQPFVLEQRLTPVKLSFADIDEMELDLTWPEGWEIDAVPESTRLDNAVGALEADLDFRLAERTLRYTRRLKLREAQIPLGEKFQALRKLYEITVKHDQQALVLVLP